MRALIIKFKGHGMANEVLSTRFQPERLIDLPHRVNVKIDAYVIVRSTSQSFRPTDEEKKKTLMGGRILVSPIL